MPDERPPYAAIVLLFAMAIGFLGFGCYAYYQLAIRGVEVFGYRFRLS